MNFRKKRSHWKEKRIKMQEFTYINQRKEIIFEQKHREKRKMKERKRKEKKTYIKLCDSR